MTSEVFFSFNQKVHISYVAQRLIITDIDKCKCHYVEGEMAETLVYFITPIKITDVLQKASNFGINVDEILKEIVRLLSNELIGPENQKAIQLKQNHFWIDSFAYHLQSKTYADTTFTSIEKQNDLFSEKLQDFSFEPQRYSKEIDLPIDFYEHIKRKGIERRTKRIFSQDKLDISELSFILFECLAFKFCFWKKCGQFVNYFRSFPSAGGLQAINCYILVMDVDGLKEGLYRYCPKHHQLYNIANIPQKDILLNIFAGQDWILKSGLVLFFTGDTTLPMLRYNASRVYRMLLIESGHASQSILSKCSEIAISAFPFGAFNEELVEKELLLNPAVEPILFALGMAKDDSNVSFDQME